MAAEVSAHTHDYDDPAGAPDPEPSENDLWFLPGPEEGDPDLAPLPRADRNEADVVAEWAAAEAGLAARLAHVAGRVGALQDRLARGPDGWRHRLALTEAAELSWVAGPRVSMVRLALWVAMRTSGVADDARALETLGWAVRRLTGGPGPMADLPTFLDRRDTGAEGAELVTDRAAAWVGVMGAAGALHPITRAAMGYHLWALAGFTGPTAPIEAAVTAARVAGGPGRAAFVPLALGGARGLGASGPPARRLERWLTGMEGAVMTALRQLDDIEAWAAQAEAQMSPLSGRTPKALREAFTHWPLLSAPMAQTLTGASRAAVQRNLTWMDVQGLIREVTGQGRFRMWVVG